MAWIESHQKLSNHPKVLDLMDAMSWDLDTTIGKLHRFWWWCLDYAEDGDLRKHSENRIARSVGLSGGKEAQKFVEAMVNSSWIDREPYFRVHDWWDYIGLFLQRKYGEKNREKWERVKKLYEHCTTTVQNTAQQLTPPNLTKPNLTNIKNPPTAGLFQSQITENKSKAQALIGSVADKLVKPKSPYKVDLKPLEVRCGKQSLDDSAKYKIHKTCVVLFKARGWNTDLIPSVIRTCAEKLNNGTEPKELFPYFTRIIDNYCNENSELLSAESKRTQNV